MKEKQAESYKSVICHELRTPLSTIIAFIRQILETHKMICSQQPFTYSQEL